MRSLSLRHAIAAISLFVFPSFPLPNHSGHSHSHKHAATPRAEVCPNPGAPGFAFADYSVKIRWSKQTCVAQKLDTSLVLRDIVADDYSCSESKPCKNGACCAKTGYCGYGPKFCGDGTSPNDECWSQCDAHAECGQFAEKKGQKCPLNVCCSEFGFCGMTEEFCGGKCQSNCDQPGSGGSGGDVQSRIIGYYEAWAHDRTCSGMTFDNIPVGSLTHLHFSFAYIAAGTFEVVPMDDLSPDLFKDLTDVKSRNSGLKAIVALGGWTFNDNDTATQPVFSDMVSSSGNRKNFIGNLLSFMKEYAFDGVDFDWEYPGAPDRGGKKDDGVNFTKLLKELQDAIAKESTKYIVSFTAPSSYWYLRHFDIKAMMEYVDWTNLMTYDLHGVWDGIDPSRSYVLAHTNLTGIRQALDLYWRNDVPANKVNLGLGFYGRSFQLSDPGCSKPGCRFKGGASPGPCTQQSGILSYKEITQFIEQKGLEPIYDEENAVKYITWDRDQWVSYDDEDTFQQKVKYANEVGLGGLLIWAIDLDTDDLQALQAVLFPKLLNAYDKGEEDKIDFEDAAIGGDCSVTECGGSCKPGEITITHQPCGGAKAGSRHSKKKASALCCPVSAAPDPKGCTWRGGVPSCNGHCQPGEVALESNSWGDGKYCEDGLKFYCCKIPDAKNFNCQWSGCGEQCGNGQKSLTYDYGDYECDGDERQFCCDDDENWENCDWHGKDGSCFDNHCDTGHQVQLAESWNGGDKNCGFRLERQRVFCCDPPGGKSPFLPVPLEYLFRDPPPKESANTDFKLSVDPDFGGGSSDKDPNESSFGFFVLASPEKLQVSIDKRDGSHWEVFDCFDSVSEEEQTVRMTCTDTSEASNCDKIHLGYGVPGTILEMPTGCGPGKYAVAKEMKLSSDQSLPQQLRNRKAELRSPIYDLTFDYDFRRVPRDLGTTQMRLDFSNEEGYWDKVVNKPAGAKRKRSLEDLGGNHKRFLEEAWKEDYHGGLDKEELHKRWFGNDLVSWLQGLVNGITGAPLISHSIDEDLTIILIREQYGPCNIKGVDIQANLDVRCNVHARIDTNFGLTLVSTLAFPPDLSNSFLYFRNEGEITAKFTLDAIATASFSTGDIELFGLENFGATFSVPGILTVGPNFRIFGAVDGEVTLAGHLESQVNIAKWDVKQTFPDANKEYDPTATKEPDRDGTQVLGKPTFNYSVSADGYLTAHIKPTITFGLDFNKMFLDVPGAKVDLVADGYIRLHAAAKTSNTGSSFCYGVDAGADLYASVEAPKAFGWDLSVPRYRLPPEIPPKQVVPETCPIQGRSLEKSLTALEPRYLDEFVPNIERTIIDTVSGRGLRKRGQVYGPLLRLNTGLSCPTDGEGVGDCPACVNSRSNAKRLAMREDTPHCLLNYPAPGLKSCSGESSGKRDLEASSGRLIKRVTYGDKLLDYVTDRGTYQLDVGKFSRTFVIWISFHGENSRSAKTFLWLNAYQKTGNLAHNAPIGPYPICAKDDPPTNVAKWFTLTDVGCTAEIAKVNANKVNRQVFATEHVYEAQLLVKFMTWLKNGATRPRGYTASGTGHGVASDAWVSGVIAGIDNNNWPKPFRFRDGNPVFREMSQCLGGRGNEEDLALVANVINGPKGQFFQGNTVPYQGASGGMTSEAEAKSLIRKAASVFSYLRFDYNGGNIWDKFTGPSNCIEKVLWEFDHAYQWGSNQGEPIRPNSLDAGLRDLYSFWIDRYLGTIEAKASVFAQGAHDWFKGAHGSSPSGGIFLRGMLEGAGDATVARMQFPKSGDGRLQSRYGAWGNNGYHAPNGI